MFGDLRLLIGSREQVIAVVISRTLESIAPRHD